MDDFAFAEQLNVIDDVYYDDFFFFQAEDGIRDLTVTGVQTCALPISAANATPPSQPATTSTITQPSISLTDNGQSKRPRDARLIHMVLASLGLSAYQERDRKSVV